MRFDKKKYFYYLTLIVIGTIFFPLLFKNLPPVIRSNYFWFSIWCLSLIVFYPKYLLSKQLLYLLLYAFLFYISTNTILSINVWNSYALKIELYNITVGILIFNYFNMSKDYKSYAKIVKWIFIFIFITSIMTLITAYINPLYARDIGGVTRFEDEAEVAMILSFENYGCATHSYGILFICLFPILVYLKNNSTFSVFSNKQINFLLVLILIALFCMQIFALIILAILFFLLSVYFAKGMSMKYLIRNTFFVIVLLFIPKSVYIDSIKGFGNMFSTESELYLKINDAALGLEYGVSTNDESSELGSRAQRFPMLYSTFVESPYLGCFYKPNSFAYGYKEEGAHLYWMNKLTTTGIIGIIFFSLILIMHIRINLKQIRKDYIIFYILASLSIIAYGFLKVIEGRPAWVTFFVLIPGINYLYLLKKDKNESK